MTNAARIAELNDACRKSFAKGRVRLTRSIRDLDIVTLFMLIEAIRTFDAFTSDNDPYDEHDFGRVVIRGQGYFWKIDAYDLDLQYHSPDPADEAVTTRIMTVMREDEY